MDQYDIDLELHHLDLLRQLVTANDVVPSDQRTVILGQQFGGRLHFFHPSFSNGQITPNEVDLDVLAHAGLIRAFDQGGSKGWKIDILPRAKRFLAQLSEPEQNESSSKSSQLKRSANHSRMPEAINDAKTEAIRILEHIVDDLEQSTSSTLESVLRRCARAALLVGQQDALEIFNKEIRGYYSSDEPPYYRRVQGHVVWRTIGFERLNDPTDIAAQMASKFYGNEPCGFVAHAGLQELLTASANGHWLISQIVEKRMVPDGKNVGGTWVEPVDYYLPQAFSTCVKAIEQSAYEWATQWLVYLRYESRITNIWQRYRSSVDDTMEALGLSKHLPSTDGNLASSNEQDWRSVLYGCRNMLEDIANHLWTDSRPQYAPIATTQNDGKKIGMDVTPSKYVNRIQAYLHQKSTRDASAGLVEKEAELLGALFARLNTLDNHAHEGATLELAETVAIHTYVLLAELIRRTDMQPIEHYAV
jgi:hypothetical protein